LGNRNHFAQNVASLVHAVLPSHLHTATVEIAPYLLHSIGNRQRIDYGSGHELNFVMFLYCLERLGLLGTEDHGALVLVVFRHYLDLMRALQKTYWLEPAGSHGVWGLDDYQFLPFLFGSAQLCGHRHIRPKSICSKDVVEGFADSFMYLGCIRFINEVKAGSFFEHSPLLFDISGAKSWEKVNHGMMKMFRAQVLGKLPIMKHFMFGSTLIPYTVESVQTLHEHEAEHSHCERVCDDGNQYRVVSCCVQRIPSAVAAKEMERFRGV